MPASRLFRLHILGCSAATPTSDRHTTSQLLQYHNRFFLLDCAEGTQMQLRRMDLPMMRINHVMISHLHGDHYLGLPGLLFSWHLLGREQEVNIYSPKGLKEIIELQFAVSGLEPSYPIHWHLTEAPGDCLFEDQYLRVETLEMDHRIPCFGFLFREKTGERNISKPHIEKYQIPVSQMQEIKSGADLKLPDGSSISNSEITLPPGRLRSYAFCSDTAYTERFLDQIAGIDLLYHEATFLHEREQIAAEKKHSTARQAAILAQKAGVGRLLLGHYSARYKDIELFRLEATEVFPDTILATEGLCVEIEDPKSAADN